MTQTDPYRWGYGEPWFLAALLLVAIIGNLSRLPLVAASISLAVLAWAVGWYESTNLWDYLIDPLLCLYALGVTSRPLLSAFAARRKPAA